MEATPALEHFEPERVEGSAAENPSFRERPAYEFRQQHTEQFIGGTNWRAERPIPEFSSPDRLIEQVNPDFGDHSRIYDVNCADCARSFEQSWRGRLEEAAGRTPEIGPEGLEPSGESSSITEEWAGERMQDARDPELLRFQLQEAGHGASAIVHTSYVDHNGVPGGHAYNVANDHGEIRVCDAQRHVTFPWTPTTIHAELRDFDTTHRAIAWNDRGARIW